MATITPVAFYTGATTISGTTQVGNLNVGTGAQDYGVVGQNNGIVYYSTPDQDLGYVIAHEDLTGGHNGKPGNVPAFLGFWRSAVKTEASFIDLAEYISVQDNDPQSFLNGAEASVWLTNNGYWNTFPIAKRVLFLGDTTVNTVASNISTYITATGHSITYSAVTIGTTYTGGSDITTANYDVVFLYTNGGQIGGAELSNNLLNFINQGGSVVTGVFLWNVYQAGFSHSGITAFNKTDQQGNPPGGNFIIVSPSTITDGVGLTLPTNFYNVNPTIVTGGSQLATYSNGNNLLAVRNVGSSKLVSINAWPAHISSSTSNICKLFGNAVLYAGGVI